MVVRTLYVRETNNVDQTCMALNTSKCNYMTLLRFKGLKSAKRLHAKFSLSLALGACAP